MYQDEQNSRESIADYKGKIKRDRWRAARRLHISQRCPPLIGNVEGVHRKTEGCCQRDNTRQQSRSRRRVVMRADLPFTAKNRSAPII